MGLVALATAIAGGASGLFRSWYILVDGADLPPGQLFVVDMPANWVILALTAIAVVGMLSLASAPRLASGLFLAAAVGYGAMATGLAVPASIFLLVAATSSMMME